MKNPTLYLVAVAFLATCTSHSYAQCDSGCAVGASFGDNVQIQNSQISSQPVYSTPVVTSEYGIPVTEGPMAGSFDANVGCDGVDTSNLMPSGDGPLGDSYFSIFAGTNEINRASELLVEQDDFVGGFALGSNRTRLRREFEYTYRSNEQGTGEFDVHAGMFNLALDVGKGRLRPYIGAGAGFGFVDSDNDAPDALLARVLNNKSSSFAFQYFAGASFQLRTNIELFGEYRFFELHNPIETQTSIDTVGPMGVLPVTTRSSTDYETENILVGLRFRF